MEQLPGITHQFGPWGPTTFVPVPFHEGPAPAFYVTTTRMCNGLHDWRCITRESQTFGPLVLEGKTVADLVRCDNCGRTQPPVQNEATGEEPVCLFCSDAGTVQHLGNAGDTAAGVAAVAALHGACGVLRHTKETDSTAYIALLDETGDSLQSVMEDAAWSIRQAPKRAAYTINRELVMMARQILANARDMASIETDPTLPDITNEGV